MSQDIGSIVGLRYTRRWTCGGVRKLLISHKRFKKDHYCGARLLPRIGPSLVLHFFRWNFSSGRLGALLAVTAIETVDSLAKQNKSLPLTPCTQSKSVRHLCKWPTCILHLDPTDLIRSSMKICCTRNATAKLHEDFSLQIQDDGRMRFKVVTRLWRFIYEADETWRFRATVLDLNWLTTKVKALRSFEMSVTVYQSAWRTHPKATATLEPEPTQHNSLDRLQIRK